jgi:hypothetical protein
MNENTFLGVIYYNDDKIERIVSKDYYNRYVIDFFERMIDFTPDEYNPREYSPLEKKLCGKIINDIEPIFNGNCDYITVFIKANVNGKPSINCYRNHIELYSYLSDYTNKIVQKKSINTSNGKKEIDMIEFYTCLIHAGD